MYLMVTILRSMRADFQTELWQGLGTTTVPSLFTYSEICVALLVLAVNGSAALLRDNSKAFDVSLATCAIGLVMAFASVIAWQQRWLTPFAFMVLIGQALYLPYVAVHTTVFERLLAMTRVPGNSGFFLYVVDSIGYLGYVAVVLLKSFGGQSVRQAPLIDYFLSMCWLCGTIALLCIVASWMVFRNHKTPIKDPRAPSFNP